MTTPALPSRLPGVGTTIFTVMSQLAAQCGAVNLSQGFPDFAPPEALVARLAAHLRSGAAANQYAPMAGAPALREAIAEKVARHTGAQYDPGDEITVTAGATQALHSAISACVRPGDEVIVFAPAYDSYIPTIEINGGRVRVAHLRAPDYRPDFSALASLLTPRTRAIILNTPHNPTGTRWLAEDMAALADLLRGTDVVVVSDEVYEHMVYADAPGGGAHASVCAHAALRERSIVVSSFGKTYHVTGWKVGYCLAPRSLMAELRKVHQFEVFAVSHPMQLALADFMGTAPHFAAELPAFYSERRARLRTELAGTPFAVLPCHATYFQLVDYSAISDQPDVEFAQWLTREIGVAAIPVSVFTPALAADAAPRIVRLCFAKRDETLGEAGRRLRGLSPSC